MLQGYRVIEMTTMGDDFCGMLLGDMGAEVIKVEPPEGDPIRGWVAEVQPGWGVYHVALNRNKRSVVADPSTLAGIETVKALVKTADAFVRTYAPGTPEELSYNALRAINPEIIYCELSTYGVKSPYAGIPGGLALASAAAGAWRLMTDDAGNARVIDGVKVPGQPGSGEQGGAGGPTYAAYGIISALYQRAKTGQHGCYIDLSHADCAIAEAGGFATMLMEGDRTKVQAQGSSGAGGPSAKYNWYETKDKKYLLMCVIERKFWNNFVRAADRPDLVDEKEWDAPVDFAGGDLDLRREIQSIMHRRTAEEWIQLFLDHDVAGGLGVPPEELAADPHIRYRGPSSKLSTRPRASS